MCGIVAYLGDKQAQPLLLQGLHRLEYRGYDSAGIAILNDKGLQIAKKKGRIQILENAIANHPLEGTSGIAHTRWATHGEPSDANAHPHTDARGKLALIHNGVIENYQSIKERLIAKGHKFSSDTDTEVLAHFVGEKFDALGQKTPHRLERAITAALQEVTGAYGIAAIHAEEPRTIVGARRCSPLLLAIGDGEHFLASDLSAVGAHTQKVVYLDDGDVVTITDEGFHITSLTRGARDFQITDVEYQHNAADKGEFPHYMLKEIFEQPESIHNAFRGRLNKEDATAVLGGLNMSAQDLRRFDRILITACGTALHSGIVGEYLIESLAQLPVETDWASEFRYRNTPLDQKTLVLVVSQSGETADTIGALREAKRKGHRVLGICNNVGSTMARETDGGVYMHAGPEIGVAATKSYTSQVMVFNLLALLLGRMRWMSAAQGRVMIDAIEKIPAQIASILKQSDAIHAIAEQYKTCRSMLFLGRLYNRATALEGALKMKEITYIHAEGHPSAELKHGVLALIDENVPSVFIIPNDSVRDKNLSSLQEVKARKGKVIAIATGGDKEVASLADHTIFIPEAPDYLTPILAAIPLQLFSYHMAVILGRDVDKPRNLAKSVTVE